MLRSLDLAGAELSVAITDDGEIRELNKVFRHRDKATDVLAFAMREGETAGPTAPADKRTKKRAELLGDVVVSVETARRQAKEQRRKLDAEIRMLLAHGLLHLIGYDHRTDREESVMNAATERLCHAAVDTGMSASTGGGADTKATRNGRASKRALPSANLAAKKPARARVRSSGSKSGTSKRAASQKAAR